MCTNVDELGSYATFTAFLSGHISKVVFAPDMKDSIPIEKVGYICAKAVVEEG